MHRNESAELLTTYMTVLSGAGLLATLAMQPSWASAPTERLRDDLLRSIAELDEMLARIGDSVWPPPSPVAADGMRALRPLLEGWRPPSPIPKELATAAAALAFSILSALVAPSETPPQPPQEPGNRVDELGLPLRRRGLRLLYNAPARALVAVVQPEPQMGRMMGERVFVTRAAMLGRQAAAMAAPDASLEKGGVSGVLGWNTPC